MSRKDTLNKAYGSIPKEVYAGFNTDWIPEFRGIKFIWVKTKRFFTR